MATTRKNRHQSIQVMVWVTRQSGSSNIRRPVDAARTGATPPAIDDYTAGLTLPGEWTLDRAMLPIPYELTPYGIQYRLRMTPRQQAAGAALAGRESRATRWEPRGR